MTKILTSFGYLVKEYEEHKEYDLGKQLQSTVIMQRGSFLPTHVERLDAYEVENNPNLGKFVHLGLPDVYQQVAISWEHRLDHLKPEYGDSFWINKETEYVVSCMRQDEMYQCVGKYCNVTNSLKLIPEVFQKVE